MSKNFELMQRLGRAWDVPPAPKIENPRVERFGSREPVLSIRREKRWESMQRHDGRLNVNQLAREEALRLVQHVFLLENQVPARVVVFAGVDHGNGCSRICAQAAAALEGNGQGSVCLVEANLRSPSLPRLFGMANHHGLADCLLSDGPIRGFARPLNTGRLWLLSSGSHAPDAQGLLGSAQMKARLEELRSEFDYVVVDAPPLTHYSDAIGLGKMADGFVLVLEANATRREAALRISENLRAAQIRVLGAVLNKRTFPIPDAIYRNL